MLITCNKIHDMYYLSSLLLYYVLFCYFCKNYTQMKEDLSLVEQTQRDILNYIARNSDTRQLPKEQDFVAILGVSRVVVREALSQLRALGIIETKRKKGTKVTNPDIFATVKTIVSSGLLDRNTLRDLFQLRIMLEIGMADFVYQNKTEEQMDKLERIIEEQVEYENQMAQAGSDDQRYEIAKLLTEVDVRFHGTLFEMTGNKSLMDFQYILRHLFTLYFPQIKNDFHERNVISHVGLYNLLRDGSPDAFRTAMRLHLSTQLNSMEAILENVSRK